MLQHNNEKYKCSDMGTSEYLISEMMLSAEVQLTCFTAQYAVQNRANHHPLSTSRALILQS